ncbi:MAG: IclR family transcriptional regulator [Pseudomonadota bacterium]
MSTVDDHQVRKSYSAPALEKGLDIVELLSREEAGLSQSEISRALGRSVSEIFRMLVVLSQRGYIALDPDTDRYTLTTLLFEVAHRTPLVKRLNAVSAPQLRDLSRRINQSVHLGVISQDAVLVIGQFDSPGNNILSIRLGARIELWRASSGRVILAFMPEEELEQLLKRVPLPEGATPNSLRRDLASIRARGHEITESFVLAGVTNIAAPVFDHTGRAIAAATVPHLQRYEDPIGFDVCCEKLIETAAQITRNLGGGIAPSKERSTS